MGNSFKIGDRVITEDGTGRVEDIFHGVTCCAYAVVVDGKGGMLFFEDELKPAPIEKEYSMDIKIDIAQNIVIATLYEDCGEAIKKPIKRGHGHIIHDGALGVAQAASYACRRMYESLGGTYTKGGPRNDH